MHDARFERQVRLAEVGYDGQARIRSSRLSVGSSPAAEIEALYLERAGAFAVNRDAQAEPAFEHEHAFRHAEARSYGAGAWRALRQLAMVLRA